MSERRLKVEILRGGVAAEAIGRIYDDYGRPPAILAIMVTTPEGFRRIELRSEEIADLLPHLEAFARLGTLRLADGTLDTRAATPEGER